MKFALLLSLMICPCAAFAQIGDFRAKELAESSYRSAEGFPQRNPLHVRRREDLEEHLFTLQILTKGQIAQAAYIFEITTTGTFVVSPDEAISIASTGYDEPKLIAVASRDGSVFMLHGFTRATEDFNRLTENSRLQVRNVSEANSIARLFYAFVFDPDSSDAIGGLIELKHYAESYFVSQFEEDGSVGPFKKWWAGFQRAHIRVNWGAVSTKEAEGFSASFTYYSVVKRTPLLRQLKLLISPSGKVTVVSDSALYP